jgi:hypothetical protein
MKTTRAIAGLAIAAAAIGGTAVAASSASTNPNAKALAAGVAFEAQTAAVIADCAGVGVGQVGHNGASALTAAKASQPASQVLRTYGYGVTFREDSTIDAATDVATSAMVAMCTATAVARRGAATTGLGSAASSDITDPATTRRWAQCMAGAGYSVKTSDDAPLAVQAVYSQALGSALAAGELPTNPAEAVSRRAEADAAAYRDASLFEASISSADAACRDSLGIGG